MKEMEYDEFGEIKLSKKQIVCKSLKFAFTITAFVCVIVFVFLALAARAEMPPKSVSAETRCELDEKALKGGIIKVYVTVEKMDVAVKSGISSLDVTCEFKDFLKKENIEVKNE